MTALRLPNNAALLERHTPLVAETPNLTRWTSVWKMIDKYIRIRDAAKHVGAVEDLLPRGSDHRRIVTLHEKMKELNSICENLQHHKRTLEEVRALFDACIEKYPVMSKYLDADAKIVHAPCFEKAVVKAIRGGVLSRAEQTILEPFRAELPFETEREPPTTDFAAAVLREAKRPRLGRHSAVNYVPLLSTISPTSNRCERLFSECKYVLESHRSSMHPATFERLMF
ncbi:hypothetical protein P3T76_013092 [Phytophthora citrophthora]|uniref:HAT C-terminal dimerisation domain-containing protein n=1 Tax=Phytophthora citrophthora TaxID=4793 RepID=A0AAD9G3A4_9STRA|nr:hypothetical protein P3T76_013092 [Phytophthora citrophthora]